jgi:hypothetical protein
MTASGIVDLESNSLAWIEESSVGAALVVVGGDQAASRLKSVLTDLHPLDIETLRIRASRHDSPADDGLTVLRRNGFALALERPSDTPAERAHVPD